MKNELAWRKINQGPAWRKVKQGSMASTKLPGLKYLILVFEVPPLLPVKRVCVVKMADLSSSLQVAGGEEVQTGSGAGSGWESLSSRVPE